jgi:hypothetical protein
MRHIYLLAERTRSSVRKIVTWLKAHPVFIGPTVVLVAALAAIGFFIDPITVAFLAVIALAGGFAALIDPKTYSRSPRRPYDE